jgi:tetratricopeptide (TPR) repeat protein
MVIQSLEEYIVRYMLQDCDADLMRGRRLAQSGQHGQAVEFLSRGLERSPRSPEAARLLSHSLQHLNRKQESLAAAEQAVRIDPTDLQNLTHLAQFYLFLGDNESAISTLAILLQLHPNSPDGQRMIASAQKALLVRP